MDLNVKDILAADGLVAEHLDGYEPREEQVEMAQSVAGALSDAEHLLAEAGTGVGKSFAYLIPAILQAVSTNQRVIVSTYTIALQEQIINKDIPFLRKVLPVKFSAVLGKGRSNYLCFRRMEAVFKSQGKLFARMDHLEQLKHLGQWAMKTETGSRQEIDFHVDGAVWDKIRSDTNQCHGSKCKLFGKCHFQAARRRMRAANIVVVNHSLFFADLALRKAKVRLLGKYDLVVLDEAHTVEKVAADHFGQEVSTAAVQYLLRELYNERTGRGLLTMVGDGKAFAAVGKTATASEHFFENLMSYHGPGVARNGRIRQSGIVPNNLTPALTELARKLDDIRKKTKNEDQAREIQGYSQRTQELADRVEALISQSVDDQVYWLASRTWRRRKLVTLASSPINVAPLVRKLLFDEVKSAILTSATLATARGGQHGFEYIRGRLGLEDGREVLLSSPFNYRRQAKMFVETRLGEPNNLDQFVPQACRAIQYYVEKTQGRCFVLFTSYKMLRQCAEQLEEFCDERNYQLLVQGGKLQLGEMLKRFRKEPRSVLLGTASFWQGVDVAGEALSNVIITKLPFAVPDEPLTEAKVEAIRQAGGNPFVEFQIPEAIIRFKQGFGRLIRSGNDTGIVVVLDHRIATKSYGKLFLRALPDMEIIRDEFCKNCYNAHKEEEY